MSVKTVVVGLAGVGIRGAIALGNLVAFADVSANTVLPIASSHAPFDQQMGPCGPHAFVAAAEYLGLTQD